MAQMIREEEVDVLVIGGGSAGIAAACTAARNGARTMLVDAGPMIGGELLSGIPVDGCVSSRGEWVVGGFSRELFNECDRLGGYIGPLFDYRALNVVCVHPEIMKIAVINVVKKAGVKLLLYTFADDVVVKDGVRRRHHGGAQVPGRDRQGLPRAGCPRQRHQAPPPDHQGRRIL
jgi:NADPH-dependent 2,4-dienoyl-CoA reductase/sulfur reductase-like enzyme